MIFRNDWRPALAAALTTAGLLCTGLAQAAEQQSLKPEQIRDKHAEAARRYMANLDQGFKLTGSIDENGSPGLFNAYFLGDTSLVEQRFGSLRSVSYMGPQGHWSGTAYSLPYQFEDADNPAEASLALLSQGKYLDPPYWEHFKFEGEDAGGYNFTFSPPGLPQLKVVLYNDPGTPEFLQVMSVEVPLCADDPQSVTYRSFYFYQSDGKGGLLTLRETGREIDHDGETTSSSEYTVTGFEPLSALPTDVSVDFARNPVGPAAGLSAPAEIPCDVSKMYFLVPLHFPGSDKTFTFLFDTGASASLFNEEAWTAAGMKSDLQVNGHGHGSRVKFELGLCGSASVGAAGAPAQQSAPLGPFPVAKIDSANTAVLSALSSYGASGILGVSLLHQYVVTFDHMGGKLVLTPRQLFDPANLSKPNVEFWLDVEDLIYFTGQLNDGQRAEDIKGDVVLDTGMQQQLSLLGETINRLGLNFEKQGATPSTVLGGVRKFENITVPRFAIGPLAWDKVPATVTADDRGSLSGRGLLGFVGVPLFFVNKITVDCFAQRMYIEAPSEEAMQVLQEQMQQMQQQMQMLNGSQPDSGPEGGLLAPGSPPMEQPQSGEPQA
ncbi:aspartyl protease family protein [bacterium]|nr:aspartyl protease family protein [bacterium]